jgi:hypothetical protein
MKSPFVLTATLILAAATPALAAQGMFSYYPADNETRELADNGFTLVFDKAVMGGVRLRKLMSTEAPAAAELEPADDRELGVSLRSLIGRSDANDLYRIADGGQGPAMIRAFCPGSTKGWLAFGPVKVRRNLEIQALGDDPKTGKARHCATLQMNFRGAWDPRPPGFGPPKPF